MKTRMFSQVKEILKYSIHYAAIMHCTFEYVGDFVVCNGPSMEPTLYSNNILLTERISKNFYQPPHRGDIIIAVSPVNPNQHICKRVVGIPGDKIITKLLKTNEDTKDDGNPPAAAPTLTEDYVPRGHIWIEGDNAANSSDSRYYGPIPMGLIKSRVVCRLWPLNDMKWL